MRSPKVMRAGTGNKNIILCGLRRSNIAYRHVNIAIPYGRWCKYELWLCNVSRLFWAMYYCNIHVIFQYVNELASIANKCKTYALDTCSISLCCSCCILMVKLLYLTLFEPGYVYPLFEPEEGKLPFTLKALKKIFWWNSSKMK